MALRFRVIVVAAVWPALVWSSDKAKKVVVDVYMNDSDDSERFLWPGKVLASGIFDEIGIHVRWREGKQPDAPAAFGIRTAATAPASATPGALASTRFLEAGGAEITIYEDRVGQLPAVYRIGDDAAAGYVLAHELAHAMQGIARHSDSGILKARWSRQDYVDMSLRRLTFLPGDVDLIREGLATQKKGAAPVRMADIEVGSQEVLGSIPWSTPIKQQFPRAFSAMNRTTRLFRPGSQSASSITSS